MRFSFRDCQRSLARELTEVQKLLNDENRLADRLESDQQSSTSLQRQLEDLAEKSHGAKLTPAELRQVSDGLSRFETSLDESAKSLTSLRKTVANRTLAVNEEEKKFRASLAEAEDPQHPLERWEKELLKLELDNNDTEKRVLELLGLHCLHFMVVLDKMNATVRIQRDVLKSLQ